MIFLNKILTGQNHGRRSIRNTGGIARGDGASLGENGLQLRHFLKGCADKRMLIAAESLRTLFAFERHRNNLFIEASVFDRPRSSALRAEGSLVQFFTRIFAWYGT